MKHTFIIVLLTIAATHFNCSKPNEIAKSDIYIEIPDENFEKALIEYKIDTLLDHKLLKVVADKVFKLDLSSRNIFSLEGIECFVNLGALYCNNNQLSKIDLTLNRKLIFLRCEDNKISTLDLSNNMELQSLICSNNKLIDINIGKNVNLSAITCSYNLLTHLDTSENYNISWLSISNNNLTKLDISKNLNVTYLNCSFNKIDKVCLSSLDQVKSSWQKDSSTVYSVCR